MLVFQKRARAVEDEERQKYVTYFAWPDSTNHREGTTAVITWRGEPRNKDGVWARI